METNLIPDTPSSSTTGTSTPAPTTTALPTSSAYPAPQTTIPITVHTSPSPTIITHFATINASAGLTDPFTMLANSEKLSLPLSAITHAHLLTGNTARITQKLSAGALLVEAGNLAAVACWEPPSCTALTEASDGDPLSFPALADRPMMRSFVYEAATWRRKAVRGRGYWHLSLMARDPERRDVKGAVRSVLEAGLWWAKQEGCPVWLEAGNQRAREVYAAFGFRELGVTWHGKEGEEVPIWMMIWEPKSDGGK